MKLLLADDEPTIRLGVGDALRSAGYEVHEASNGREALELVSSLSFDAVISDIRMPEMDGLRLFEAIQGLRHPPPVILMTAYAEVQDAVSALKAGAWDYLTKPFAEDELLARLERLRTHTELRHELHRVQAGLHGGATKAILGESDSVRKLKKVISMVALSDAPVLVTGETGTGKELVAKAIHQASERAQSPFVALNCAAIPENLIESELFGHEKGAFTGAALKRLGKFRRADTGSLFLDEVGELPAAAQAKLLRVSQEGLVEPVGADEAHPVDVRLIAATHRDLRQKVTKGEFREDLLFRLKVVEVAVPPLRERKADIPLLVQHFIDKHKAPGMDFYEVADEAWSEFQNHSYPGNVRELEQAVRHALIFATDGIIRPRHLPQDFSGGRPTRSAIEAGPVQPLQDSIRAAEKVFLMKALAEAQGKKAKAAELLGISRKNLWEKLKAHDIGDVDIESELLS